MRRRLVVGAMVALPLAWSVPGARGRSSGAGGAGATGSGRSWDEFLTLATEYLRSRQKQLKAEFGLGTWERYDFDQVTGTLRFSAGGKTGVIADVQVVGTTGKSSGTWLWSWGNDSILESVKTDMAAVRDYGKAHGFEKLTDRKWPGGDDEGWDMTAAAAYILRAEGGYGAPDDKGSAFMIMRKVRRVTLRVSGALPRAPSPILSRKRERRTGCEAVPDGLKKDATPCRFHSPRFDHSCRCRSGGGWRSRPARLACGANSPRGNHSGEGR